MKKKLSILVSGAVLCTTFTMVTPNPTVEAAEQTPITVSVQKAAAAQTKASATLSASQVAKKITTGMKFPSQVIMNQDMFKDLYKINRAYLKSYQVKMPVISAHSNEVAVFQVKDKKHMNKVLPQVKKRLAAVQKNSFYPEQVALAKKGKVVTKGNYILLVIDQNATKIINNFNKTVK